LPLFLLYLIPSIQAALSFKYPTAFTLNNGKIFVIHSLGIDICDSKYTTSTNILTFSQRMTKSQLSTISISKYSTGEFLLFIINKFYLFDEDGNKLIETENLSSLKGEYYTLKAHKRIQSSGINYYYFIFGYIDISDEYNFYLYLYYYNINTSNNLVKESASIILNDNIDFNGLSCEFVLY
jgi:hypothetical protein